MSQYSLLVSLARFWQKAHKVPILSNPSLKYSQYFPPCAEEQEIGVVSIKNAVLENVGFDPKLSIMNLPCRHACVTPAI